MGKARIHYGSWLVAVIAWDGLLPMLVLLLPFLVEIVFPKRQGFIEVLAVILPILFFFVRIGLGHHHIASNHCGGLLRAFQHCALGLGVFILLMVDCMLILSHNVPKGAMNDFDRLIWLSLIATYLTLMAIAMYPGGCRADTATYGECR